MAENQDHLELAKQLMDSSVANYSSAEKATTLLLVDIAQSLRKISDSLDSISYDVDRISERQRYS